jgi:hypothetical protein
MVFDGDQRIGGPCSRLQLADLNRICRTSVRNIRKFNMFTEYLCFYWLKKCTPMETDNAMNMDSSVLNEQSETEVTEE